MKVYVMGGFAGGDEGGYWDDDSILTLVDKKKNKTGREKLYTQTSDLGYSIKAYRKDRTYNTISFIPCRCKAFTIEGYAVESIDSNSIHKAYEALSNYICDSDVVDFFSEYKVVIENTSSLNDISELEPSDTAAFMRLTKEVCNLMLSNDELAKIGNTISSDISFYINK